MITSLIIGIVAWGLGALITKQKNIFKKPEDVGKRPRWLFALLFSFAFFSAFAPPLIGSIASSSFGTQVAMRFVLFAGYSSLAFLGYIIYRLVINVPPKSIIEKIAIAQPLEQALLSSDGEFYLKATEEFENGNKTPELWAKAMAICEGDKYKAKYKYINMRVQHLTEEKPDESEVTSALTEEQSHETILDAENLVIKKHEKTIEEENQILELEKALELAETRMRDNRKSRS